MSDRAPLIGILALTTLATGCQAEAPQAVWQEKCARCHGEMSAFAEKSLCLADSMPALRDGGEKLATFLAHHGRLTSGEVDAVCRGIAEILEVRPRK